jgi:hypothetical protein
VVTVVETGKVSLKRVSSGKKILNLQKEPDFRCSMNHNQVMEIVNQTKGAKDESNNHGCPKHIHLRISTFLCRNVNTIH